jgi:predicted acylesterase/phospholipase RssA
LLATGELTALLRSLRIQDTMQRAVEGAQMVELSSRLTPDVSIIDAMAASCAFFIGYQVDGEELHDGFYFSNLPTRVITRKKPRANVLAHQTNPFIGESWTNWFLRRVFNPETIELLQERFAEDEELAEEFGVLLAPRVQEITSPFSIALSPDLIKAGRDALSVNRFQIDQVLLKRHRKQQRRSS